MKTPGLGVSAAHIAARTQDTNSGWSLTHMTGHVSDTRDELCLTGHFAVESHCIMSLLFRHPHVTIDSTVRSCLIGSKSDRGESKKC